MTNNTPRPTKNERRAAAREQAKQLHQARMRREKMTKGFTIGGIILGALAVVGIVVFIIATTVRPPAPGPLNMASDGFVIGEGLQYVETPAIPADGKPTPTEPRNDKLQIVVYQDYMCPYCAMFETNNAPVIEQLVSSGAATVEYRPVSFLDRYSVGERYSTRAMNAAGCVAEFAPEKFFEWNAQMFAQQPAENTTGLSNSDIIGIADGVGIETAGEFSECVNDLRFGSWIAAASDRAATQEIPFTDGLMTEGRTPFILVNGERYAGGIDDAAAFQQFLTAKAGELSESDATPAPSEG